MGRPHVRPAGARAPARGDGARGLRLRRSRHGRRGVRGIAAALVLSFGPALYSSTPHPIPPHVGGGERPSATGSAPSAPQAPLRVASLNLTADEVLVDILPPDRLIGVTRWADDPSTSNVAGRVPAGAFRFPKADLERLVALGPDLVVVSEYTDADFLRLLERSGMRTHRMTGLASFAGIRAAILDLGRAVGAPEAAARLAVQHEARLRELDRRLRG